MKMETLQQRRDELERKENKLKESLLKFDKFVKVSHRNIFPIPTIKRTLLHLLTGECLKAG